MTKPHYIQIAQQLTAGIKDGVYPLGALMPTEFELCDHFQTSRHTVRAALSELQQLGLVERKKNVGTRVVAAQVRGGFQPTLSSLDDLIQFGVEHSRRVQRIETVTLTRSVARELKAETGSRWVVISSLRLNGSKFSPPIGWTDVYLDPAYEQIAEEVRLHPATLVSSLVETRFGRRIAELHQEISGSTVTDPVIAAALDVPVGSAALRILRRYLDAAGKAFEITVTTHPSDRFSISLKLRCAGRS
jgi:GntR family transcriptional regulator